MKLFSPKFGPKLFITVRNGVAKVMFLQACVCPQGGYLTRYTPPGQDTPPGPGTLPGADTPPGPGTTPRTRYTPHDQVHPHPPRDTATAADGTHPTGMHSC